MVMKNSIFVYFAFAIFAVILNKTNCTDSDSDLLETTENGFSPLFSKRADSVLISFKKKAGSAPLDPNESLAHELDSLNQILGVLGASSGGLVQGLTGVSIHDCAGQLKGKDLDTITCQEFINELSQCESLQNVQDLVVAAGKKKYKKKMNSKEPCFSDKKSRKSKKTK